MIRLWKYIRDESNFDRMEQYKNYSSCFLWNVKYIRFYSCMSYNRCVHQTQSARFDSTLFLQFTFGLTTQRWSLPSASIVGTCLWDDIRDDADCACVYACGRCLIPSRSYEVLACARLTYLGTRDGCVHAHRLDGRLLGPGEGRRGWEERQRRGEGTERARGAPLSGGGKRPGRAARREIVGRRAEVW